MAILRKEIADFTNLHNATKNYRDQNMRHALNNLELRENVRQFKDYFIVQESSSVRLEFELADSIKIGITKSIDDINLKHNITWAFKNMKGYWFTAGI